MASRSRAWTSSGTRSGRLCLWRMMVRSKVLRTALAVEQKRKCCSNSTMSSLSSSPSKWADMHSRNFLHSRISSIISSARPTGAGAPAGRRCGRPGPSDCLLSLDTLLRCCSGALDSQISHPGPSANVAHAPTFRPPDQSANVAHAPQISSRNPSARTARPDAWRETPLPQRRTLSGSQASRSRVPHPRTLCSLRRVPSPPSPPRPARIPTA